MQQPPPVQRLRVRYAKRGRARFTSHRDFARAFERALRRAEIPMAYSSGFSPHPRISYANAAATGAASEAESLEIALALTCQPEAVREALDQALPTGLDVLEVVSATATPLTELLQASRWLIDLVNAEPDAVRAAVAAFVASASVPVERMTRSGRRVFDARVAVESSRMCGDRLVEVVIRHGEPRVRPDDVVAALRVVAPDRDAGQPPLLTRLAQGPYRDGQIGDPFAD